MVIIDHLGDGADADADGNGDGDGDARDFLESVQRL